MRSPAVLTDLVADGDERMPVALVAGATRGAGRAIAVELARAGFFVYATGRSSQAAGVSTLANVLARAWEEPRSLRFSEACFYFLA